MGRMGSGAGLRYREGVLRIAEQWPSLRYLGMGAWWAWIWLCYSGTGLFAHWPRPSFAQQVGQMYLYSTPAIVLALVAAALAWRRVTPLLARWRLVLGVSLLATLGSALIASSPLLGGAASFSCGAVLTGLGTSVLALQTGQTFGSLGGREALGAGSASLVFASFLYFVGIGLPVAWQPVFIACMPPLAAALFSIPSDDPFPADEQLMARAHGLRVPGMRSYVRLVVAASLVAATAGFAKGLAAPVMTGERYAEVGAVSTFLIGLMASALCVMVNVGDIVRSMRRAYAVLIFFGVAVALLSAFGLELTYISIGRELLWMTFTCLMAYTAFKFGFSPVRAFGFGQAACLAASAASWWLGMVCLPLITSPSVYLVVVVVLVLAIVLVFVFVFTDADIKFIFTWRPGESCGATAGGEGTAGDAIAPADGSATVGSNGRPDVRSLACGLGGRFVAGDSSRPEWDGPADVRQGAAGSSGTACLDAGVGTSPMSTSTASMDLEARIAALPTSLGVSTREAQVMLLFAHGHSANWIAEDLVISKNTVRSHIRSIYTKLDVHSRRELLEYLTHEEA